MVTIIANIPLIMILAITWPTSFFSTNLIDIAINLKGNLNY